MLRRILKYEWKNIRADRSMWFLLIIFVVLTIYGIREGVNWVSFQKQAVSEVESEERERYARLKAEIVEIEAGRKAPDGNTDPRMASIASWTVGTKYAVLPPGSLSILSIGQSDLYPYYFRVSRQSKDTFINNDEIENPTVLLTGKFDLSFVIIYLLPLLILSISYNLLSAEREDGTLSLLMSQPISLQLLTIGKIVTRVLIFLMLPIITSLVIFWFSGISLTENDVWWRLGFWILIVLAYGSFWFALATLVNSFSKNSATNAVILIGLWLFLVIIIPTFFNLVAATLYPIPSRVEMIQSARRASADANARGSQLLSSYYEDHPQLVEGGTPDMTDFFNRLMAVQEETERLTKPVADHFDIQVAAQQKLVTRFQYISPAIVAQEALNNIAGTSAARHKHFLNLVDDFHRRWRDFFVPRIRKQLQNPLTVADYNNFPAFNYQEETPRTIIERTIPAFIGILVPAALFCLLGLFRLRRYQISN